jgi:glycerophosphoryl diester phosphodiesterase
MDRHPYLDGPYPRAYAHRGWHIDELAGLENTLAAFHRAVKEGFGYLEMDVHASADGAVVVHHDATLDRTTDGNGLIGQLPAAELARVRVRGATPGAAEPLPLLADVLAELPDTRITVEIKSGPVVGPLLALLERTDSWHRVCVGSYDQRWLQRARAGGGQRLCTSMAQFDAIGLRGRAWLDALPWPLRRLPALPVQGQLAQLPRRIGPLTVVDRGLLEVAHAAGREVHVWTVNDPAEMAELLDLGVDGLLSDRPDLLRTLLQERDQWPG